MSDLRLVKNRLRRELTALRKSLDPGTRGHADAEIASAVTRHSLWSSAQTVFCYYGVGWETGTLAILRRAWDEGKLVALPLVCEGGAMEARLVMGTDSLTPGLFGIPQPRADSPLLPRDAIDLALVPAIAFDRQGYRLGRGGGYYDRYLKDAQFPSAGLCYTPFLFDRLPAGEHDIPVGSVFTEEGEYTWV